MAEKSKRKHKWLKRISITVVSLVLFYTVMGFWGVPLIIRYIALPKLNDTIAGHGEIEAIYFNPYTYRLEMDGMAGYTPDGQPAVGMKQLRVDFDFQSLFADNLRIEEVSLIEPSLQFIINEEGEVNLEKTFASINEQMQAEAEEPKDDEKPFEIPVIDIGVFQIENASITARLDNMADSFQRQVNDLSFVMRDIRTSPDKNNPYHFNFDTVAGEQVTINGNIKLDPLSSTGSIAIDRVKLPDFYKFANNAFGFTMAGGEMSFSADYSFLPIREPQELSISNGHFLLTGLDLRPRGSDEPFQTLERLDVQGISVHMFRGKVAIDSLDLINGTLKVVRDKAGVLSLLRYLTPEERQAELEQQVAEEKAQDRAQAEFMFGLIADQQDIGLAFTSAWKQLQEMLEVTWDVRVGKLNVENQNLVLIDEVPADPVKLTLGDINLDVTDMANQSETPFPFDLTMKINETGQVSAKGTFTSVPPAVDFEYTVSDIDLTAFNPYVEAASPAQLNSASFTTKGKLKASFPDQALPTVDASYTFILKDFDATVGAPLYDTARPLHVTSSMMVHNGRSRASFADEELPDMKSLGDVLVQNFALGRGTGTEPLVAWDKFTATAIDTSTHPLKAMIDTVTLDGFMASVTRSAEGAISLQTELTPKLPEHAETPAQTDGSAPKPAAKKEKSPSDEPSTVAATPEGKDSAMPELDPANVGLRQFVLKNGTVKVTDESVTPASSFTLKQIHSTVGPFSFVPGSMTDIDTSLTLENGGTGTIQVEGQTLLIDPLSQSTVKVNLRTIPMAGFAGYAVQAIGSPLTGGSFNGDFSYGIKTDELKGDNKMNIKKVRFGKRVPDSKAPNLPLSLGIAVMENRDGFIVLDVPVDGSLDDPKFTIDSVISTALSNIFEKVATAPFALLGSAFGSSGVTPPSEVLFAAGSTDLPESSQEPLTLLAKAIYDRPALALKIIPSVDMKKDVADFKEDFVEENIQDMMKERDMSWPDAVEALFEKAFPEGLPAKPDGTEVTLTPGLMKSKLVEVENVPDTALQLLARQRALSVQEFLLAQQQLDAKRVTIAPPEGGFARDGAKVSFELGVTK